MQDLTYGECAGIAQALEAKERARQEQSAALAWKTAEMVGQYIVAVLCKNAPRPQGLYQAFPWMHRQEERQDWRALKARMTARAQAHNARMAKER